jgi:DNA-directed RNA polymerase subunit RPC12/RpoP
MSDATLHIRCQRCGDAMEMRDPGPGMPWTPDQFWVCNKCGRHFWTTYPPPKPAAVPAAAVAAPATPVAPAPVAEPAS